MSKTLASASIKRVVETWAPFDEAVGGLTVHSAADYRRVKKLVDELLDVVGDDETHSLAPVLDYLAFQLEMYESEHARIPDAEPHDVLRFLMDQHGLKQSSFEDEIPQSRISEILSGRRKISKAIAKTLAKKFKVGVEVFL